MKVLSLAHSLLGVLLPPSFFFFFLIGIGSNEVETNNPARYPVTSIQVSPIVTFGKTIQYPHQDIEKDTMH